MRVKAPYSKITYIKYSFILVHVDLFSRYSILLMMCMLVKYKYNYFNNIKISCITDIVICGSIGGMVGIILAYTIR